MTMVLGPRPSALGKSETPEAKLRKTALQLESVFVKQLFTAMRATVPNEGGVMPQSSAENTFTELFDQKISEQAPTQWSGDHSLAEALYQQLRTRLPSAESRVPSTEK